MQEKDLPESDKPEIREREFYTPPLTDTQWEHIQSICVKHLAFFEENGRRGDCCEFRGLLTDDEARSWGELIVAGTVESCGNEECPAWGDAIKERNGKAVG